MHVAGTADPAWASGWAACPTSREPTTLVGFASTSRPSHEFKRAFLAARITHTEVATGDRCGIGLNNFPFLPFFFLVTNVQDSGIKSDNVMGTRDTFGIGPIHGLTIGDYFSL